ncbi:dihydrodipicolinate reductase C-terminal domain-containing protein [Cloacibacillus sp. An23]|uniref:4-hydroxy-tetrahydrodipicolinate reductase n=1 Tax=Cloacibacillus sp. An23 TaxID=1965591 RepID=UPI000B39AF39|nr:dihydrodipicolinate reductase C-terminal domain-containing protein [Cloacibacillus sp. An23]OUO94475.1 4-hydroxy-tetrahydrodipicolinate reductase [Cloacibacillus sp. An23]
MARIFIAGASGNVGRALVREISKGGRFELAGGWCREAGEDLGTLAGIAPLGVKASASLEEGITASKPDIVVEFSAAAVMRDNLECYLRLGADAVVGTTGLKPDELAGLGAQAVSRGLRWAALPNYALGVNLVARFLREAREYYPYASVIDRHTPEMGNAPSGTAVMLAGILSERAAGAVKSRETYDGALGADIGGTRVFAERISYPGPFSGHTIRLAREDEVVTIDIDDYSSGVFTGGVLMAARKLLSSPRGVFITSFDELTK